MNENELKKMNIAFDFSNPFAIAKVSQNFKDAETFAKECVYYLAPYVANKFNIEFQGLELVAISQNNKVVVYSVGSINKDWVCRHFRMSVKLYDEVDPCLII